VPAPTAALTNAELTRRLIAKHGVDRYPTLMAQTLKVYEELGEVTRALLRDDLPHMRAEMADTALALYALADKLGFDLDEAIRHVVEAETRVFANPSEVV
jgi:NTP pyrophosphatase (non-canonical NTP hydrolase)